MFILVTISKLENTDGKIQNLNEVKCLYKIADITHIQEYDKKTCIIYSKGSKMYVNETIEQIQLLLNGANAKTAGVLYGNE